MTNKPYVLIVSTIADVATDDVVKHLARLSVPHRRVNTENYPFSRSIVIRPGVSDRSWIEFDEELANPPESIWYRRLRTPPKPDAMDAGVYEFCLQETRAAIVGGLLTGTARWMSHPSSIWQAEHKVLQLKLARDVGLRVPRTVISNDPALIRQAFQTFGSMIVKPVRSGYVTVRGEEFAIFTSRVLADHLDDLENARWNPAIYQELIPKAFDIRVTIVGTSVFAAAIDSQSDPHASIDWRQTKNPKLPHYEITLPNVVVHRLLQLMGLLNLSFGAIDLVKTPDDEYVFLEINPSGQWLWLDDILGLGISGAIAEWLRPRLPQC